MINVVIVANSALMRSVTRQVLEQFAEFRVTREAKNCISAFNFMETNWPDVVLLDTELADCNAIEFIQIINNFRPIKIVVFASLTFSGVEHAYRALEAGAVGVITKPTTGIADYLKNNSEGIAKTIRVAAAKHGATSKVKISAS